MIRFFRNIRQKLAAENKVMAYLRYAIGEILLVVIGILIALQINNWSEKQKELNLANVYYCRILEDFELDMDLIEKSYDQVSEKISLGRQLILDLHKGNKNKHTILNEWLKFVRHDVFVPRKIAFNDLISSGNLKLLTDVELKDAVSEYYSNLDNILGQIDQNRNEIVKRSYPNNPLEFGMQEFDYVNTILGKDILSLLPNNTWTSDKDNIYFIEFQNNIVFTIAMFDRHRQHLKRIVEEMQLPYTLLKEHCERK